MGKTHISDFSSTTQTRATGPLQVVCRVLRRSCATNARRLKLGYVIVRCILIICCIVISGPIACDADELLNALQTRGSIELRDTPLNEAVFAIRDSWRVNVVVGQNVQGSVNGVFRDAPLHEVLDAILIANGFGYRRSGNSLIVVPLEEGVTNPLFATSVISVESGDLEEVLSAAASFSSPQGQIKSMASTNSLIVTDSPERVGRIRDFVKKLGQSGRALSAENGGQVSASQVSDGVAEISPHYVEVGQLEKPLQDVLGGRARIAILPEENRLLVIGDQASVQLAERVVGKLDVPRPQVKITAFIYDISLNESERLGVNWTQRLKGNDTDWLDIDGGLLTPNAATEVLDDVADVATDAVIPNQLAVQTLSRHFDLNSIVRALDETKGARLLADPSVTVVDREAASIRIVTKVPVQQLTQTEAGGNIGTTTFEEAGITMTVTPYVSNDGTIKMKVTPTFSVLTGFQDSQPIIDTREADTVVRVADRQTLVIGGLRQRSEVETVRGVPHIMNLPIIGRLFRDHGTEIRESELVVFIQPEIIHCGSGASPRQELAGAVCTTTLDRIPYAEDVPFIPDCRDKSCPYHHPRPRVNGGSEDLRHGIWQEELPPSQTLIPEGEFTSEREAAPEGDTQFYDDGRGDAAASPQSTNREVPAPMPQQGRYDVRSAQHMVPAARSSIRRTPLVRFHNWVDSHGTWSHSVLE